MSADADEALIADRRARERVVDPKGSFIVQAPAGSGKTELLVQRLLALLATVDDPAEVLAITFTRKAAQEMRERLIGALEQAAQPAAPSMRPVELARRALALPVLARDQELGWRLREQPDRLVIDTFDAFCARIVARSYLSRVAGEGALGSVTDAAETLYHEAATRALGAAEVADAVRGVLTVAGNQVHSVVELLAGLLARRAQWLGAAIDTSPQAIAELTAALRDAADAAMRALVSASDALGRHGNIAELSAYCATVWDRPGSETKLLDQAEARRQLSAHWPLPPTLAALPHWQTLAAMLLTGESGQRTWRKPGGVNKTAGFPKHDDKAFADLDPALRRQRKEQMVALLEALQHEHDLARSLDDLDHLPTLAALAEHETALRDTLVLLRHAAIELVALMRERGVTDFSGIMTAALAALRDNRADVMANLDAKLRHVLVDEVQDTNPAQFELLALLTADWTAGDGRTLFLVGDPMQSIYLFRDADVSLFRRAQRVGVGGVRLTAVTLNANYRSQPAVVDWVNHSLDGAFASGARGLFADRDPVPFVAAIATHASGDDEGQSEIAASSPEQEAQEVAAAIEWRRQNQPEQSIAVLARTRGDAAAVIAALRARGVPFSANEFALWSARERVRDLLTLTYAVAAPWDRLALFALLRSPWVGLTLDSLSRFAMALRESPARPAWTLLAGEWATSLDTDELTRVRRAHAALRVGEARAWLSGVAERVEAVWCALDGDALLADNEARRDTAQFFEWLAELAPDGLLPPRQTLLMSMESKRQSFASATADTGEASDGSVELLTIHRAKGLEWDHVFVVGCDRAPRADQRSLAAWRFQALPGQPGREQDARSYAFAARDTRKREAGSVYDFLARFNRASRLDESKRQLYVAVTRARRTLTISRQAAHRDPPYGSFSFWLGQGVDATATAAEAGAVDRRLYLAASLTRGPVPAPLDETVVAWPAYVADAPDAALDTQPARRLARAVGIVGHLLFEGLAATLRVGALTFSPSQDAARRALVDAGAVDDPDQDVTVEGMAGRLVRWFASAPAREHVRFLFAASHRESVQEFSLSTVDAATGLATGLRVDHSFVTEEGERWIVDYKFAEPEDLDTADPQAIDAWVSHQCELYAPQLAAYRQAFAARDRCEPGVAGPDGAAARIVTALYFPWLDRLQRCE